MATIHGKLLGVRTRKPYAELRVQAWTTDRRLKRVRLAEAVTNEEGSFELAVEVRAADVFFVVMRGDEQLLDTDGKVTWNERTQQKAIQLELPEAAPVVPNGTFSVSGVVSTELGVAAAGVRVELYDHNVTGVTRLANGVTGADGRYAIAFDPAKLGGKQAADLEVRVSNANRNAGELARSAVLYQAPQAAVADLVVDAAAVVRTAEFGRLGDALAPLLGDVPSDRLDPDGVTYLAERSGWDGRSVALAAQAAKLEPQTGIPAEHYYALLRSGASAEDVALIPDEQVVVAIKTAIDQGVIADDHPIDETVKRHAEVARGALREMRPSGAVSSFGDMISLALDRDAQDRFIDVYRATGADQGALWDGLKAADFDEQAITRLQTIGALGKLTLQNAPLVERLLGDDRIATLDDLAGAGLHDPARWAEVIRDDVPEGLTSESYAVALAAQVNLSAPTLVAADLVRRQEVVVDGAEEVAGFLTEAHGKFRLGSAPLKTWDGFSQLSEPAQGGALRLERLYQVSPSNGVMSTLSRLGVDSAMEIAAYPRQAWIESFGQDFSDLTELALTHQKATQVATTTLNLATMYLAQRANPNVYALSGKAKKPEPGGEPSDVVAAATLEELFNNMDYCACEACNSVFSPAAYFVDLLEFIDLAGQPHAMSNPLTVLLERRPDLEYLLLSCENTNVALPYVDIVNEVLEYYVVNGNLAAFKGFNLGSDANTADLLADPQFVRAEAYAATKAQVHPWTLPFDMPLAGMRLLFEVWGTTLSDALDVFGDPAGARRERLGLSDPEYRILTDSGFHTLPEYFGEPAAASIDDLNDAVAVAKTFCRRVDISYEQLADMLQTRFVNPAIEFITTLELLRTNIARIQDWFDAVLDDAGLQALFPEDLDTAPFGGDVLGWLTAHQDAVMHLITLADVSAEPVECDFAQVELRFALPKPAENRLTDIAYLRLVRFIRLWRKLELPIDVTDDLIAVFLPMAPGELTPANLDDAFVTLLARVANFGRLRELLAISDKKAPNWLVLWDPALPAADRLGLLAGLLRIGATDLAHLCELTGIDPLAADMEADDPSLLRFARTWLALKASPLKVADLDYLLRDQDLEGKLQPGDADLLRDVRTLRAALAGVETDVGLAVANPDLNAAKAKMALVYDAAIVDRFFAFISETATYTAAFATAEETLPAKLAAVTSRIDLDPFGDRLTFTSILDAATQAALDAAADALLLGDVTEIDLQADLDAFIAAFKVATQALLDAGEADLATFAEEYPELSALVTAVAALADPAAKANAILTAILPELRAELKRNALRAALAVILKADGTIVDALTSGAAVLSAADGVGGVLDDFQALEAPAALDPVVTFELWLDPVATGDYILYVSAPEATTVTLVVGTTEVIPATAVDASGEVRSTVPLALTAGALEPVALTLAGLPAGGAAQLRWRTKAVAKGDVPAVRLIDAARAGAARTSLIRLRKAAQLQSALELTAGELAHFAGTEAGTTGVLDALDTDASIAAAVLHDQWARVERLIWFARVKADHEQEPDTLLGLLRDPGRLTPQGKHVLAGALEWDETSLVAVLGHHGLTFLELAGLDALRRVARTMDFVMATLQPASDLLAWAVAAPDAALFDGAKATLRARMTDSAWRESIQSVSDALRNQRRDALVAYILFHDPPEPEITTPDELYEHFLLDVQMDACMQTSRIRLALSTVQLFIDRCFMNLESAVELPAWMADRWTWMQRYRVWEANRRIFIYPENWLEPELRDSKSPFFRDLESELLKADITDELADEAYFNYLKKLDDVAKLEVVASYLHERKPGDPNDDVLHVFARTGGATRQYYSRRFEGGYWTPWEAMSLHIEGDLLVPVVWRNQLYVFWVVRLDKPAKGDGSKTTWNVADQAWGSNATITAELTLAWGEYYKGKWTSPKSTEMKRPLKISGLDAYDPDKLVVSVRTQRPAPELSERLVFSIAYLAAGSAVFRVTFTSKHSEPLIEPLPLALFGDPSGFSELLEPVKSFNYRLFWAAQANAELDTNSLRLKDRTFEVGVDQPEGGSSTPRSELILTKTALLLDGFRVRPVMHGVENQWEAPFFYSDEHSIFVVQGDEVVWNESWFDVFYDVGPAIHFKVDEVPKYYEKPVIGKPGDPVINPWEAVVNPNFTQVIKGSDTFVYEGVAFDAKGRAGIGGGQ
jgi:hypothetical protein